MLYDSYHKKISRVLNTLRKIFKHIVLISIVTGLILAAIIAFMITKGIVLDDKSVSESFEMTYGEDLPVNSKAFFARVIYEYSANGVDWSTEPPIELGEYKVRASAKTLFGQTKYGMVYSFKLNAKPINVTVVDKQITYGDIPNVFAELAVGDKIICESFLYADRLASVTNIVPVKEEVKILNSKGEDITSLYNINLVASQITILPRNILVTVSDKELIYNDTKFSYDGYELSGGTLAEGDILQAVFSEYLIDVGSVVNTPQLSVVTADGLDISVHYNIDTEIGMLTVDYRPLIIGTGSSEKIYDDKVLFNTDYEILGEYGIVDGHVVECVSKTSITDVKQVENVLNLEIKNADGEDKTPNYSIFYERGTLTINPRPINISTDSATWVYDGQEHYTDIELSGFVEGHEVSISWPSIIDVGTIDNDITINSIYNADGVDVISNYDFIYGVIGELTVTKRPITIAHENSPENLIYDGTERVFANYVIVEGSLAANDVLELEFPSFSQAGVYKNQNKILSATVSSDRPNESKVFDAYENYEITEVYGTIKIEKCALTLKVLDDYKEYDRLEYFVGTYIIIDGNLPAGHTINETYLPIGIDVGSYDLNIDLASTKVIYSEEDVTVNFELTVNKGIVTVAPRTLKLQAGSAEKIFDGLPLTSTEYSLVDEEQLLEGDTIKSVEFKLVEVTDITKEKVVLQWRNVIVGAVIVDASNNDISRNYNVVGIDGSLDILQRKLSIMSNSETKTYDRKELRGTEVTIDPISEANDGLLLGHTLSYVLPVSVINVGSYDNEITELDVLDENGNSVKRYYDITANYGVLEILPISFYVITESKDKVYDGTPLTHPVYDTDYYGKLLEGDVIEIVVTGTITNVGSFPNQVQITLYDPNGIDITDSGNYVFEYYCGMLTVTPRPIKINPLPTKTEKLYDGTPLECIYYEDLSDIESNEGLIDAHVLSELYFESITNVGSINIAVDAEKGYLILDGDIDVSQNYQIVIEGNKTLTVLKRVIVIESDSAKKEYDGRPLTAPKCSWSSDSDHMLAIGHEINLTADGSQTDEGKSLNTIVGKAQILDAEGIDHSANYDITYKEGTLEVYKVVVAKVESTKSGPIYLKVKAYGDYNGQSFDDAPKSSYYFSYKYNNYTYRCGHSIWSSINLYESGYLKNILTVTDATTYMLPYYMALDRGYDMPSYNQDDYSKVSTDTSYVVPYYDYSYVDEGTNGLYSYWVDKAAHYHAWVDSNYLNISDATRDALLNFVYENNFTPSSENKIKEIASFVRGTSIINTDYDIALDSEDDIAVAFLTKYKEGSAKHFAIAATMLYRAMGVPARYVEGYWVEVEAYQQTDVKDAHYWVEVFVENYGWMQVEVAFDDKIDITIKPKNEEKVYNGTPLEASKAELFEPSDELKALFELNGYTIEGVFTGSRTDVGTTSSTISNVRIYDDEGNDITYKFNINTMYGTLKVTPVQVDILLYNISKTYDEKPASYTSEKFYSIRSSTFKQMGYELYLNVTFTEVNVHKLTAGDINRNSTDYVTYTIMDGDKDVTHNFYLNFVPYDDGNRAEGEEASTPDDYVVVEIKPRKIEITSASQTKYYTDGAKLINTRVTVTMGSLAGNQKLVAFASGVIDAVGSVENIIDMETVAIVDEGANNVTTNYEITVKHGILTFLE